MKNLEKKVKYVTANPCYMLLSLPGLEYLWASAAAG